MKTIYILILLSLTSLYAKNLYSFRNYAHVKAFYKDIIDCAIETSLKNNIPPASVLAIAGLESGFGSGYVSQITGNILSLGAFKGDRELPSLYLPYSKKEKRVLFLEKNIHKYPKGDLVWSKRAKSLKKDYRPKPHAGTVKKLDILVNDKILRKKARKACFDDFGSKWISIHSKFKVFKDSRIWLNNLVKSKSKKILFSMNTNIDFIHKIGGKPNSFNYRKTWPQKVIKIMKKTGLIQLVDDIHNKKKTFEKAWSNR